jgi:tRNA A37 threonylcarbamoyladenosine dehydratase
MKAQYNRTAMLFGGDAMEKLRNARVAVFGVGGVGGYVCEALARSGVGSLDLIDNDVVSESNINRQIIALRSTVGRPKTEVMAERIRDIDPGTEVTVLARFYRTDDDLDLTQYDWVVDAIDDVNAKTALIKTAVEKGVNIISAMGAAGKFGTAFKVTDISKTSTCPLAKVMRKRLRDLGIEHLPVVFSDEKPVPRRGDLGTLSYVPGSAGLCLAGYVIRQITGCPHEE